MPIEAETQGVDQRSPNPWPAPVVRAAPQALPAEPEEELQPAYRSAAAGPQASEVRRSPALGSTCSPVEKEAWLLRHRSGAELALRHSRWRHAWPLNAPTSSPLFRVSCVQRSGTLWQLYEPGVGSFLWQRPFAVLQWVLAACSVADFWCSRPAPGSRLPARDCSGCDLKQVEAVIAHTSTGCPVVEAGWCNILAAENALE